MKKDAKYSEAPKSISDFLPPPKDLTRKEEQVKITINLSKRSIDFFKRVAADEGVPYQTMIKSLLDRYADRFEKTS